MNEDINYEFNKMPKEDKDKNKLSFLTDSKDKFRDSWYPNRNYKDEFNKPDSNRI